MRKIFVIATTALLMVAAPSQAQLKFGVKAGLNVSKVTFDENLIDRDNRTGFFVGPMAEFTIPIAGLGVDAALLYSNKNLQVCEETTNVEMSKTMHSVDIPINLKYTVGLGSMAGVYVATGPQFSFAMGNKSLFENSYTLKSSQFSWNVGAGVKLVSHLQVGYNYNIDLGNTADVNSKSATGAIAGLAFGKMKNNTHQVSVAYIF